LLTVKSRVKQYKNKSIFIIATSGAGATEHFVNAGTGSGSVNNKYGSATLKKPQK
jgi:hypothetical protein